MKTSDLLPPIRPPLPGADIARDISRLTSEGDRILLSREPYQILTFRRSVAPALFHELARQREITFRAAGQGSGTDFDETPEDDYYTQLVLWDRAAGRLAGAYRIGLTAEVLPVGGIGGLYLSHMFDFDPAFFENTGPALELSRSFVSIDYQGDRLALALLWQGLGQFIRRSPGVRSLFGSVTISASYAPASRELLVTWLARHRLCTGSPLVHARVPYPPSAALADEIDAIPAIDALRARIAGPAGEPLPIPPLIRHYLPLGATFHAFHREANFGNSIYCLLDVSLDRLPLTHRKRFLNIS